MNQKTNIAIIIGANLNYTPFYYRYEKILLENNTPFDLIIWNRDGSKLDAKASRVFEYSLKDKANNGNWTKAWKFIGFSSFVKKMLCQNKYEYLFFLGTYSGNGVLIADFLKTHYKERYWLDIRDYTYEWFKPYSFLERKSVKYADAVTVSSKGFLSFLPKYKEYIISHNIDWDSINLANKLECIPSDNVIRISFIGNMRYIQENQRFLDVMANDNRFKIQYFGTGCECLKQYCADKGIYNVSFKGQFNREETAVLYSETDMINNLYGNDRKFLKLALSNKLYYSIFLGKPILVCKDTYMEDISIDGGVGFVMDYSDPKIKDKIIEFNRAFDPANTKRACLKQALIDEDNRFILEITNRIHMVENGDN